MFVHACIPYPDIQESHVASFNGGESHASERRRLGCVHLAQLFDSTRRVANLLYSNVLLLLFGITPGNSAEKCHPAMFMQLLRYHCMHFLETLWATESRLRFLQINRAIEKV